MGVPDESNLEYVSILLIDKEGADNNTLCLFGKDAKDIFMKTATYKSILNSQEGVKVEVLGTYKKTQLKVVVEGSTNE